MTPKIITQEKAQARLETLCMRAEHSEGEMRAKLRAWGISPDEADAIVEKLKKNRFVDDERFARAFVRDKLWLARWGKRKTALALAQKRVCHDIIERVLGEVDQEQYLQSLATLLAAKLKGKEALLATPEGRAKVYRFAASRGFESQLISQALSLIKAQQQ